MTGDHRRLDQLLERAGSCQTHEELRAYDAFRRGLLKHIGMEEKILLPAAQRLRGGEALELAARLRSDHGALVSLLMPSPTPAIIRALKAVLAEHNPLEEGASGVYAQCEEITGAEAADLLQRLHTAPEVPTSPNLTNPRVIEATRRALQRAGYDPRLMDE